MPSVASQLKVAAGVGGGVGVGVGGGVGASLHVEPHSVCVWLPPLFTKQFPFSRLQLYIVGLHAAAQAACVFVLFAST